MRWADLESSCVRVNEVRPCTTVAASKLKTMGVRSCIWRLLMTSSRKYLAEAGSTRPATRLMAISTNPRASKPRRGLIRPHTSGRDLHADFFLAPLVVLSPGLEVSPPRDRRSDRRTAVGMGERGSPWGIVELDAASVGQFTCGVPSQMARRGRLARLTVAESGAQSPAPTRGAVAGVGRSILRTLAMKSLRVMPRWPHSRRLRLV